MGAGQSPFPIHADLSWPRLSSPNRGLFYSKRDKQMRLKGLKTIAAFSGMSEDAITHLIRTAAPPIWFEGGEPIADAGVLRTWVQKTGSQQRKIR